MEKTKETARYFKDQALSIPNATGKQSLPVCHTRFVKRHKVDLTGRTTFGARKEHLIVPLAQEL